MVSWHLCEEVGRLIPDEIRIGDVVQTRKPHPCGSSEWTVTRIGADIKMRCSGCGRVVMLDRETFLKRRKKLISQGPSTDIGALNPTDKEMP